MNESDIITFLKQHFEPLEDTHTGQGYWASVYLKDGTFLPCVVFRNSKTIVDLAIKRLKEEKSAESIFSRKHGFGYREIVKAFVAGGNCVNHYDMSNVIASRFAFPTPIHHQIRGETAMGWTAFVAGFNDDRLLSFGTAFNWEFFDLPENFEAKNIVEIINNSYISKSGVIVGHHLLRGERPFENLETIHREKPFFECYMDHL